MDKHIEIFYKKALNYLKYINAEEIAECIKKDELNKKLKLWRSSFENEIIKFLAEIKEMASIKK